MENNSRTTKNRYTDNAKATRAMVTRTILDRNIRGLQLHAKMALQESLEVDEVNAPSYYEFERADRAVCCTLRVEFDRWGGDRTKDVDGSEWRKLAPKVEVSWPGHGTSTPALAAARIELYQEVLALANEILASMPGAVMSCVATAEEIAKDEAERAAKKLQKTAEDAVDAQKGMRAGAVVRTTSGDSPLPAGAWNVIRGTKSFEVESDGVQLAITRSL